MQKDNIGKLTGHTFRKSEDRYENHSNEKIDPLRTKYNIDATQGGKRIETLVAERLASDYTQKHMPRVNAVLAREIIIQASTDVYDGMNIFEKIEITEQLIVDSLDWFCDEFGDDNILGYSAHLDEDNPHVSYIVMPMTPDGRLTQHPFFKGPSDLKRQHREYRTHMVDRGWDFDMDNKYERVDGLSLPHYKANAEMIDKMRAEQTATIRALTQDPQLEQQALDIVCGQLLREREEDLEAREAEVLKQERWIAIGKKYEGFNEYVVHAEQETDVPPEKELEF